MNGNKKAAEHGTAARYNKGCRCKRCTMAKSAKEWAQRRAKEWDTPIRVELRDDIYTCGDLTIASHMIVRAIERRERIIKQEVLQDIWKMQRMTADGVGGDRV